MRLLRLHLKAVGPFTSAELDLSAGREGLHLIYGPNEAGKTSALRALSHLLFGFPLRTPDDFVHPYDQLRVGATLRHSDGETLDVLRRKGNKNTLRAPDDTTTIAPGRLERFLGGVDQETFENLFGIDHARLKHAGEEIRTGQGRLGELLFAAGTGLAGLGQAKQRLQDRLDALFKPRGQNQRINQSLNEYRVAQDEIKRAQLPSEEWQRHDMALRAAQQRSERLMASLHEARRDLSRLNRIRDAITPVARWRRLRDDLARMGNVVRLRDSFGRECREAQEALQVALRTIEQAREALVDLEARLAEAEPQRLVLDSADEIEALKEMLGAVDKGLHDRSNLEGKVLMREHEVREILGKLGHPRNLDAAEELRLSADLPPIIRSLGQRFTALRVQREETRNAIAKNEDHLDRLEHERSTLGDARDVAALRRAVQQARKLGDLDAALVQSRAASERMAEQAAIALSRLPGWSGGLDALEKRVVPLAATIDRFESEWQEFERAVGGLDDRRAAEGESIARLEAQLRALGLQQDVPTEDDLRTTRQRRDEGWRLVRAAWLDHHESTDATSFTAEFAPGCTLADAFEQSQARADSVSDRLRREAEHVARKAEWLTQLEARRAACAALDQDRAQRVLRFEERRKEWEALVQSLGVSEASPAELRAWLRARAEVVQLADQARNARRECEQTAQVRAEHLAAIGRLLAEIGECGLHPGEGLGALVESAEDVLRREETALRNREALAKQIAEARANLARDRLRLQSTEDELGAWRADWAAKMARIGLDAGAAPEQADVVLTEIQTLFESLGKRRDDLSRIRGIDRDAAQFAEEVAGLCHRVGAPVNGETPAQLARVLTRRLQEERTIAQQRAALIQQHEREVVRLRKTEEERDAASAQLERLCREARCTAADDLAEAERRSRDRTRLEDELHACEDTLLNLGAGTRVDDFATEVERADLDDLTPAIAGRETEIEAREAELHCVKETIGAEREALSRMNGSDAAARAAENAQNVAARLQADIALYAKLRLAAAVLDRSIECYRDKNQGPVLARAGRLFADLTTGSFARLQIDDDGDGRAVLKGVRADGRLVAVDGMSDGSHDQLYLALRLASLESWLQAHEPIPFVVDDILLNFDDHRALSALRALAELSQRTQVLFFTHHRHLIELAQGHLPVDVAFVHELPQRGA